MRGGASYGGLAAALRRTAGSVLGTVEFYPEEGKYHYDGHRACGVCWHPSETKAAKGLCRVCGRPVTVGVLHRATALADRPEDYQPADAPAPSSWCPWPRPWRPRMTSADQPAGAGDLPRLLEALGPEIPLLRGAELRAIDEVGGTLAAEAIRRVRAGEVEFRPGYDGEYGALTILRRGARAPGRPGFALRRAPGDPNRARTERAETWQAATQMAAAHR